MQDGIMLIISGPAGSGKNTVAERLMAEFPNVERVITSTSRQPRGQEKNGIDYHFLSVEDFESGIKSGEFLEYAKVHDRYYGTSKSAIETPISKGKDVILIIDVQGAETWKNIAKENAALGKRITSVFVAPDSIDELRKRLKGRATESEAEIDRRMETAVFEYTKADLFDKKINSKSRDEDYSALREIYLSAKAK